MSKNAVSKDSFFNSINLGIRDILILNGFFVLFIIIYAIFYFLTRKIFGSQIIIEFKDVLFYIFFGVVIFLICKYKFKDLKFLGLNQPNLKRNITFISALIFFIYFIISCAILLSGKYLLFADEKGVRFFISRSVWFFLLHSFIAISIGPVIEEIIFRGFFYPPLRKKLGVPAAVLISSLIFLLWHFLTNPKELVLVFLTGILLAYIYEKTMSLVPCIIVHSIINLNWIIAVSYKYLESTGKIIFKPVQFELLSAILYLILSLFFYFSYKKEQKKEQVGI